jgi:glycosyltransferase involved in cell wall biosynthesis
MSAELMLDSLSKFKPNLIYTNTSVICEGAIVAYKLRVPHIWHVHEIGEKSLNSIYDYGIAFTSKFINDFSSHVIFNSKVTENYFSKYIKKEKSSVVYNSILLNQNPEASVSERVFTKENSHKLLTAGIISAKKNQFDVIKAINILVKNGYNVELAIFGNCHDPILLSKIQNYILNNNLSEAIHIHSFVNNPYPYFKQTNIVVVPSINDSFGRTILEGMIFNKPVIAASSGGSKEIIVDGVNGYLYKPHKHTELASKIIKLMTDSYIRDLFINNGKETANKFTELNYSRTIYEKLTSNLTIPSIDSRYKRLIFKEL